MAVLPVRKVAVAGVLSAVVIVLGITRLGLIPWFSGASVTILHVPVILAAILEGPVVGLIVGALFGLFAMLQAGLAPTGPLDPAFVNPLVSIVPRLCIGLVAAFAYFLIAGRGKQIPLWRESLAVIVASLAGSFANTVLVLSSLYLFAQSYVVQFLPNWTAVWFIVIANGLPEALVAAVVALAVVLAWRRYPGQGRKSRFSKAGEK